MANGKNVATKQQAGALAKINFAEDANLGLEKMTAQDLAIPLACWLGFKEINLLGCDGGFRHFFQPDGTDGHVQGLERKHGIKRPRQRWDLVIKELTKRDIFLYNCSPTNALDGVEYKDATPFPKVVGRIKSFKKIDSRYFSNEVKYKVHLFDVEGNYGYRKNIKMNNNFFEWEELEEDVELFRELYNWNKWIVNGKSFENER